MSTNLKIELILKGIKQVHIAERAGVDNAFVCRVVNGRQKPSLRIIEAFNYYGIELKDNAR